MKYNITIPFLPVKIHVMDQVKTKYPVNLQMVTLKKSVYSRTCNCWISTDYENVYKIEKHKCSILIENINVYDICEIQNSIYLIHENGYTVYPQIYKVNFDGLVQNMNVREACIIGNENKYMIVDLFSDEVYNFKRHHNASCIITKNINNKFCYDYVIDNKLYINERNEFKIPSHVLGDPIHSFEFSNEKFIILKVSNYFTKHWYILFDKQNAHFKDWLYMKEINNFIYFSEINKTLVEYDELLLLLSNEDLYDLFCGKSFEKILEKIDSKCDSIMYSIDKHSKYSFNHDKSYVYYINNNKLMATMTYFPYDMHILCNLNKEVSYITSYNYEILIQYTDLNIDIISI